MKFEQIGEITEKQKAAVKSSDCFRQFVKSAYDQGSQKIILISEVQESGWIKLYAKNEKHTVHYWVEVGVRGGLTDEKNQIR